MQSMDVEKPVNTSNGHGSFTSAGEGNPDGLGQQLIQGGDLEAQERDIRNAVSECESEILSSSQQRKPYCTRRKICCIGMCTAVMIALVFSTPLIVHAVVAAVPLSTTKFVLTNPTTEGGDVAGTLSCSPPMGLVAHAAPGELQIKYGDRVVGKMTHGKMELSKASDFTGKMNLGGPEGFAPFVDAANDMITKDVALRMVGNMQLSVASFLPSMSVGIDKSITLNSLQGLASKVDDILMTGSTTPNQVQSFLNVTAHNPSFVSMELGAAKLEVWYQGELLGVSETPNLHIVPGDFKMQATGYMVGGDVDHNQKMAGLFSQYLSNKPVTLTARGAGQGTGAKAIPWVDALLKKAVMTVTLPGYDKPPVTAIDVLHSGFGLVSDDDITMNASMRLHSDLPMMTFPYQVTGVKGTGVFGKGLSFGMPWMSVDFSPVSGEPGKTITTVSGISSKGKVTNLRNLQDVIRKALTSKQVSTVVSVDATMKMATPLGEMTVDLPVTQTVQIKGMNQMPGSFVDFIDVVKADKDEVVFMLHAHMPNPTNLALQASVLPFTVNYLGAVIGRSQLTPNLLPSNGQWDGLCSMPVKAGSPMLPRIFQMVSRYTSGNITQTQVRGDTESLSLKTEKVIQPAMAAMDTSVTVYPVTDKNIFLIKAARLRVNLNPLNFGLQGAVEMYNPFSVKMSVKYVSAVMRAATGRAAGIILGKMEHNITGDEQMDAGSKEAAWGSMVPVEMASCRGHWGKCATLLKIITEGLLIDLINTSMIVEMGDGFEFVINDFSQANITVNLVV